MERWQIISLSSLLSKVYVTFYGSIPVAVWLISCYVTTYFPKTFKYHRCCITLLMLIWVYNKTWKDKDEMRLFYHYLLYNEIFLFWEIFPIRLWSRAFPSVNHNSNLRSMKVISLWNWWEIRWKCNTIVTRRSRMVCRKNEITFYKLLNPIWNL